MRKSFSLIEVVLACTVLIMFLMAGLILFGTGIRNVKIAAHRLQAVYLANQKLEELTATRDDKFFANQAVDWAILGGVGSDTPPGFDITFSRSWDPTQNGPLTDSRKIKVTVGWTDFSQSYSITVYKYLTKWQN